MIYQPEWTAEVAAWYERKIQYYVDKMLERDNEPDPYWARRPWRDGYVTGLIEWYMERREEFVE